MTTTVQTHQNDVDTVDDTEVAGVPQPNPDDTFDVSFSADDTAAPVANLADTEVAIALAGLAGLAALAPPGPDAFPGRNAFVLGASHPAVTRLGTMLIARGGKRFYKDGAGPEFTVADRNACAAFQRAQGWSSANADGYPGPTTWDLLVSNGGKNISRGGGPVTSPVPGFSANYAYGIKNRRYQAGFHTGVDYAAPVGTPIVTVTDGTVVETPTGGAYGVRTMIRDADGHVWLYAHQSRRCVRTGASVAAGEVIGYVGTTGNVTGPHLHLEKSKGRTWTYGQTVKPSW